MELWLLWRSGGIKDQLASELDNGLSTHEGELEVNSWDGWLEVLGGDTFNQGNSKRDG